MYGLYVSSAGGILYKESIDSLLCNTLNYRGKLMAWSGLFDDIGGAPHALLNGTTPLRGLMRRFMQKRGLYGMAKESGGTVPSTRKQIDSELPHGGLRTLVDASTDTEWTTGEMDVVADTQLEPTVAVDLGGNGGAAMT